MAIKRKKTKSHNSDRPLHHNHAKPPKPPSRFLWIMEAVLVSLAIFAVLSVITILWLAATNHQKAQNAIKAITGITPTIIASNENKKIHSFYGFEITINTQAQEAEAIENTNSGLITGERLYRGGPFTTVNVYNKSSANLAIENNVGIDKTTYMAIQVVAKKSFFEDLRKIYGASLSDLDLLNKFYAPAANATMSYSLVSSEDVNVGGNRYKKNVWEIINNQGIKYKTKQTDYLTVQNGLPYKSTIYQNAGYDPEDMAGFVSVLESTKFYPAEDGAKINSKPSRNTARIIPGLEAKAATNTIASDSAIQVVANNMPSVVKVATVYCIDFNFVLGAIIQPITGGCGVGTGSGFIVSPNGYVATNGHVVKFTEEEVLATSLILGDKQVTRQYLDFLVNTGQVSKAVADQYYLACISGNAEARKELVGTIGLLPSSTRIKFIREDVKYAVQLSNDAIKFNPNDLKSLNYGSSIVAATLVGIDYDPLADIQKDGFRSSDVAVLKLDGNKQYPYVTLGGITTMSQGDPLVVLGFPGIADNELVDSSKSVPTATEGKVSSIRDANNSKNKLIQSDVSITYGNSGGPAFNKNGEVIGIATYGYSDTGAKVNYMRDIEDLKKLLSKNNIVLPTKVEGVEKTWEDALAKFAKAYYTPAISLFNKAKAEYPQNRVVNEFIAKAEAFKKEGKEAISPETYALIVGGIVGVIIIPGLILFFVVRHHRKRKVAHQQYTGQAPGVQQVAQAPAPVTSQPVIQPGQVPPGQNGQARDMLSNAPAPTNNQDPSQK